MNFVPRSLEKSKASSARSFHLCQTPEGIPKYNSKEYELISKSHIKRTKHGWIMFSKGSRMCMFVYDYSPHIWKTEKGNKTNKWKAKIYSKLGFETSMHNFKNHFLLQKILFPNGNGCVPSVCRSSQRPIRKGHQILGN